MPPKPMSQKRARGMDEVAKPDSELSGVTSDIINHVDVEFNKIKLILVDDFKAVKDLLEGLTKKTEALQTDVSEMKKEVSEQGKILRFVREEQGSLKSVCETHGKSIDELISKTPYKETAEDTISVAGRLGSINTALADLVERSDKLTCQIASVDEAAKARDAQGIGKVVGKLTKIANWMNENLIEDEG